MLVQVHSSAFVDAIRSFDSCDLSYSEAHALYDYLDGFFEDEEPISIGDYAILSYSTTLATIREEYDIDADTWDDIDADNLDAWAIIPTSDHTAVIIGIG